MNKKIRVLLVDDEAQFVTTTARILKARGFDVTAAFDGYEAVEAVKHGGGFDVVVLDIKMPGLDGVAALGEIKKRAPDTEVIMLTGHAALETGTQAMRKGAYDYLMKPCDIEDLVEKIKEAHEAEEIRRHPVLWPRKLVGEITLHSFCRLHPEDPLSKALETMSRGMGEEAVEEVYVVNDEEKLLGVITKKELVREAQKTRGESSIDWLQMMNAPEWLPDKPLMETMRPQPFVTHEGAYLTDAANQMILHHLRRMPVMRSGKMIGLIRLEDVFQYLEHEME